LKSLHLFTPRSPEHRQSGIENVKIDFLRNIHIFSSLTEEELHRVGRRVSVREYEKNEVILREEDSNEFMYFVLSGKAKVVHATEEGKEIILAIHHEAEFFGEISLLDGKTSPATVLATENSLIAIISKRDFYAILSGQHKVIESLMQMLCSRLRDSWHQIRILNRKTASQRIKMLLLSLSRDRGRMTPEGIIMHIRLTHQDIADMSGLTRETVTKVLDQWKKDGRITVLKNRCMRLNAGFLSEDLALKRLTGTHKR
jgi:CRP/FNR family cyclic AMP-dependent transcriptional regulator